MAKQNLTLLTDLYQLTMMQGYFKNKDQNETVIFDAFYRSNPQDSGYAISAGLEQIIEYIKNLRFNKEDIEYLASLNIFEKNFLDYLESFHFSGDIFGEGLLSRNQFASITRMLQKADHGLAFTLPAIMKVYSTLDAIANESERFVQFLKFMYILYELSRADDARVLASSSFAHTEQSTESRRVQKVKQFINEHYAEQLKLSDLADLVGMSPVSFSRFFRHRTGRTLSDYIVDIRLGYAARMLVDSSRNISEICYECGFNNLSNFNRTFKAKRNYTPRDFRAMFKKNKVIV